MKIHLVYFSATFTTRTVCEALARYLGNDVVVHDITNEAPVDDVVIPDNELLVIGMPVYCGRVPEIAAERVNKFYGRFTRAIAVVVYGNRAYDDALLELSRMVEGHGFCTIAAAAFIGRHCIFPMVATDRPDALDQEKIADFAELCRPLMQVPLGDVNPIEVPGNHEEYCPHKRSAFCPEPTENCINCGTCAELCPTGAISLTDAREVDGSLCIACGRCILVCSQHGRHFVGEAYSQAAEKFSQAYGQRKEPEFFLAKHK